MSNSFVGYDNIVSGFQPVDATTAGVSSAWIDMKTAHEVAFLLQFGVVTATNVVTVTVEASTTNASTTGVAVPFLYRQSGIVTANTWGAVTSCTSAGAAIAAASLTGTNLWVECDLPGITNDHPTARWIKVEVSGAEPTANLCAGVCFINPRYRQITYPSAT
jgi:hypothetical protein